MIKAATPTDQLVMPYGHWRQPVFAIYFVLNHAYACVQLVFTRIGKEAKRASSRGNSFTTISVIEIDYVRTLNRLCRQHDLRRASSCSEKIA